MKGARKSLNPMTVAIILAIVAIVAVGMFWRAARGRPVHQPGAGRWGATDGEQQGRAGCPRAAGPVIRTLLPAACRRATPRSRSTSALPNRRTPACPRARPQPARPIPGRRPISPQA